MNLRDRLREGPALCAPGVADALAATLAAQAGFELLFVSGAGVSWTQLGKPDVGLMTLDDLATQVARIRGAVDTPLLVDADTGFGNAANMQRCVRVLEAAGATAIQIEDQGFPKRCGHMAGKTVVPLAEAAGKVHAAVDARRNADTLISARTDALALEGLESALERIRAYADAGADMLFVEAPLDAELLRSIGAAISAVRPLVVNMVETGPVSALTAGDLSSIGFRVVLFPVALARAAAVAQADMLDAIAADGSIRSGPQTMPFHDINEKLGLSGILADGARYGDET
jgi:2-methylisocitrate lyase-like PEP mutase family enzyme